MKKAGAELVAMATVAVSYETAVKEGINQLHTQQIEHKIVGHLLCLEQTVDGEEQYSCHGSAYSSSYHCGI